jgi:hypothetical protein
MNAANERWLYRFFSLMGYGLVMAAAYCWFTPPANSVVVAQPELKVTGCVPGEKHYVAFRVENQSGKPVRIINTAMC